MFTTTIPAFLASDAIIGTLALIAWIFIVAVIVWLGEKAVEKFLGRTATRAEPITPENGLASGEAIARTHNQPSGAANGAPTREPSRAHRSAGSRTR